MSTPNLNHSIYKIILCALLLVLLLSGCGKKGDGQATPSVEQIFTQIAMEVSAGLTQTAAAKPQEPPTVSPEPVNPTPAGPDPTIAAISTMAGGGPTIAPLPEGANPTEELIPTDAVPIVSQEDESETKCKYRALLAYESPKDSDWIQEKKNFKRIWLFTNVGDCTWPRGMVLRFISGELFGAEATQVITDTAIPPGERVRVESQMRAPALAPGVGKASLQGNWMLGTPDGRLFGSGADGKGYFWVTIVVCEEKICKQEGE